MVGGAGGRLWLSPERYYSTSYDFLDDFPEHFHFARERHSGVFLSFPLQS